MMKYFILVLFLSANICAKGQTAQVQHIPKQPYNKYIIKESVANDSVTFYLSEFSAEAKLPLIVYIQGSGNSSLFTKDATGKISPTYGHISWAYTTKDKAKLLIIEKPGVNFLDQLETNLAFDKKFSLESWAGSIEQVINYVIKNEKIDTAKIMIAGHSEGGLVAARVARQLGKRITHVSILAGEGPSQLYSLYRFAESGVFFDSPGSTAAQRIDSLTRTWKNIVADPLSTTKKFWGFTFLRWSSFLQTSVAEELYDYNGKVLILQGDSDKNVLPESANVLYTSLLSKGKTIALKMIPGADHSFNIAGNAAINGWELVIGKCIDWFLKTKL